MSIKIKPVNNFVLLKEIEVNFDKTSGGIIVNMPKDDMFILISEVIGVGPQVKDFEVGMKVLADKRRCVQHTIALGRIWLSEDKWIVGILEDDGDGTNAIKVGSDSFYAGNTEEETLAKLK
jgi:hypothetical protein